MVEEEIAKSKKLDGYNPTEAPQPTTGLAEPEPSQEEEEDAGLSAENECTVCMERQVSLKFQLDHFCAYMVV